MIPYGRQDISQSDIDAVVEVLRSDWLTQGPMVPKFERAVADYAGAQYAVAVNSATSALHIACLALGLGPGDWLWTSPNTFVASANCALYCGANVDFVDIDPCTYNMSVDQLEDKLKKAARENRLPKVVVPVHFAGQPCDMPAIHKLAQQYGFKIIEDASHAVGASYRVQDSADSGTAGTSDTEVKVGCCAHSDITVFSFHPVKILTTGEGGMALTNHADLSESMGRLRTHGVTVNAKLMRTRPGDEIWNYQQVDLGFNYRMTDMQAALGLSQLQRLDAFVGLRRTIAFTYDQALESFPLVLPWQDPRTHSSYHLYPIRIQRERSSKTQREIYRWLHQEKIMVNVHYIPVYRQPFYEARGFKQGYCPEAERYYQETISLPIYAAMTQNQQETVIAALEKILRT